MAYTRLGTMQDLLLQTLVVAMMAAIGLDLTPRELTVLRHHPRHLTLSLLANLVAFPLLTFGVSRAMRLADGWTTGLVLAAASPGGPTGPVFAKFAKGHVGAATSLMVLLGFCALATAPLTVDALLGSQGDVSLAWPIFRTLLVFQIAPLVVAMAIRHRWPGPSKALSGPVGLFANLVLLAVVVLLLSEQAGALLGVSLGLHGALIALLALFLWPGRQDHSPQGLWRGLSQVTAVRNLSVALLLASAHYSEPTTHLAILLWGWWMMVLPVGWGLLWARRLRA